MPLDTINDNVPVDIKTAATMIGCGERFLRRLCQERRIRYLRMGANKVRFLPSDLVEFMADSAVEPNARRTALTESTAD